MLAATVIMNKHRLMHICPTCQAGVGEKCVTRNGNPVRYFHQTRTDVAMPGAKAELSAH